MTIKLTYKAITHSDKEKEMIRVMLEAKETILYYYQMKGK